MTETTRLNLLVLAASATIAAAPAARADQVVLTSVADNTLIEDPAGAYSCGTAQYFFAGRVGINGASTLRRGALRFSFSSIPAGSTITSVSLKMYCSAVGLTSSYTVSLKKMNASWGEGASTAPCGSSFAVPPRAARAPHVPPLSGGAPPPSPPTGRAQWTAGHSPTLTNCCHRSGR